MIVYNNIFNRMAKQDKRNKSDIIYFYGHYENKDPLRRYVFSNFFPVKFTEYKIEYNCSEQYYMAKKALEFNDKKIHDQILKESDQKKIKALGRKVSDFDQKVWDNKKFAIMVNANYLKYSQNEDLKQILLNTGEKELAEASPYDNIWGIGMDRWTAEKLTKDQWKGQNLLGKTLMLVRDMLKIKKN